MYKVINQANYLQQKNLTRKEVNNKPSLTVPDQSMPLKVMIERFVRGQSVEVFTPTYLGEDNDIPDTLERMDPMDRLDLSRQIKKGIKQFQEKQPVPPPAYPAPQDPALEKPDGGELK